MKTQRKLFFLFFLFVFPLLGSNIINGTAATSEIPNATLFQSNLNFKLNTPENIRVEIGGKTLTSFKTLGSTLQEDDYRLYHARLFFDVEANIYTTYSVSDVFPSATSRQYSTKWLDLYTSNDPDNSVWIANHPMDHTAYSINYNSYSLGSFSGYGLNGFIGLDVSFNDLTPESLDFGTVQIESNTKAFVSQIAETTITDITFAEIGQYDSFYEGDNIASLTALDLNGANPPGDYGIAAQIANLDLGVKRGTQTTPTYQQGEKYIQAGVISNNQFYAKIKPDVKIKHEQLINRYQYLVVDVSTAWLGLDPAGIDTELTKPWSETSIDRIIGWEVKNYNAHVNFKTEVDIFALSQLAYDSTGETDLSDLPAYQLEDMFFNNLFYGDTGGGFVFDSSDPVDSFLSGIWEKYWPIIVVAAIIALLVTVGPYVMPFIMPMIQAKSVKGGGNSSTTEQNLSGVSKIIRELKK